MKIKQKRTFIPILVYILSPLIGVVALLTPVDVFAYQCESSDYYDSADQVCRAYKEVAAQVRGDGSRFCPPDASHMDDSGRCWAKGGDKKSYPPKRADGSDIPASDVSCSTYHVGGTPFIDPDGSDVQTHYYPDRHSCCAKTVGGVINPSRCVDPDIPEEDPTEMRTCRNPDGTTVEVKKSDACPSAGQNGGGDDGSATPPPNKNPSGMACATDEGGKNRPTVETSLIPCQGQGEEGIGNLLKFFVVIMSVGVGILAVGGILYGALLYASAQDNASQTKKAVEIITNTALGLILYMFMVAILNWLVPGGVITG